MCIRDRCVCVCWVSKGKFARALARARDCFLLLLNLDFQQKRDNLNQSVRKANKTTTDKQANTTIWTFTEKPHCSPIIFKDTGSIEIGKYVQGNKAAIRRRSRSGIDIPISGSNFTRKLMWQLGGVAKITLTDRKVLWNIKKSETELTASVLKKQKDPKHTRD